jgi:hypothetical protein
MNATRSFQLSLGPEPRLSALQHELIATATERGWHPIVCHVDAGVSVVAVRVETARTVRQRTKTPATAGREE